MSHPTQTGASACTDRRRGIVGSMTLTVLNAALLCLGLVAVMVWGGTQVSEAEWVGTPNMATERALKAEFKQEGRDMVNAQVLALGCTQKAEGHYAPWIAVRNAKGADTGVVRVVSFQQAWDGAKAGMLWVEGFCGSEATT